MASIPNGRASRSTFSPQVTLYTPAPQHSQDLKPDTSAWVRRSSRSAGALKPDPEPEVQPRSKPTRSRHFKSEVKVEEEGEAGDEPKPELKPKVAKVAKPKPFKRYLEIAHPAPKRWREAFEIIKAQRKG